MLPCDTINSLLNRNNILGYIFVDCTNDCFAFGRAHTPGSHSDEAGLHVLHGAIVLHRQHIAQHPPAQLPLLSGTEDPCRVHIEQDLGHIMQ